MSNLTQDARKGAPDRRPRSAEIAGRGIRSAFDFAEFMSALIADVINEDVSHSAAGVAVAAGGKLLKVVEMQQRYGVPRPDGGKDLSLCAPAGTAAPAANGKGRRAKLSA